jgi:TRAP-type C4-dicarboxylate transport system permease small subunit
MTDAQHGRAAVAFRRIDKVLLAITNLALVVIVGTVCWTVWSRYVARSPVVWGEDVTSLAFAWFIFIGMAAVHNRRDHVGIDIVTSALPRRAQRVLTRVADAFVAIFSAYTAYLCGQQAVVSHTMAHSPVLELPLSYFFASLTVGFALMALRSVAYLFGVTPIEA